MFTFIMFPLVPFETNLCLLPMDQDMCHGGCVTQESVTAMEKCVCVWKRGRESCRKWKWYRVSIHFTSNGEKYRNSSCPLWIIDCLPTVYDIDIHSLSFVCVCVCLSVRVLTDRSSDYKYRFKGRGEVTRKAQEEGSDPRPFSSNAEMPENETSCNSTHLRPTNHAS